MIDFMKKSNLISSGFRNAVWCALLAPYAATFVPAQSSGAHVPADPQEKVRVMKMKDGDVFPIPETGALVVKDGNDLKIQFAPPAENRRDPYKSVDLQSDDLVLMANGKRVKSIKELSAAHGATQVGAEFKLGIQRGKEMMIVSLPKADPRDLPQRQMRIMTSGGEGTEILPAVGVVLKQNKKSVVIDKILPLETSTVKYLDVKEGDVIQSINGTSVSEVGEFVKIYDGLDVGSKVIWKTGRKGKDIEISFSKPKPMGGPMIIRRKVQ